MNAMRYNIKRIFFGGFFIRGHPYTMDTISYAIRFWSKVGGGAGSEPILVKDGKGCSTLNQLWRGRAAGPGQKCAEGAAPVFLQATVGSF